MIKRTLSIILALIMIISMASLTLFTVSAEEATVAAITADESTQDEATVDEPKLMLTPIEGEVNGTIIGCMGDINDDKKINIKDSSLIQKYLARFVYLNERFKALSDVDNNQKINIKDSTTLQKYIAKLDIDCVAQYTLYETGTHVHNFVETLVEASCTIDGYTLKSCICGEETKENVVTAKGHDYKYKLFTATCVDDGYTLYSCKNCNSSYKSNITGATGKHVFSKGECKYCQISEKEYSFDELKDFLIENGTYDSKTKSYSYELSTSFTDTEDAATVIYSKQDKGIAISYACVVDGYLDVVSLGFYKDSKDFIYYMFCEEAFECAGTYNMAKYSTDVKNLKDIEIYYYDDANEKDMVVHYTLHYIDFALGAYEHNQNKIGVDIKSLGFEKFEY